MSGAPKGFKNSKSATIAVPPEAKKGKAAARVVVRYDVGFGNALFIRGQGAGLNWTKGILLHNVQRDEWVWESQEPFESCEFKVLFNDTDYELGENHVLKTGDEIFYTPRF